MRQLGHSALLTLLACASVSLPAPAQDLAARINAILTHPDARRASWAVRVADCSTGAVLADLNGDVPMTPASNTKLFSTAFALVKLGPDYRFETKVLASAPPSAEGVLAGDLLLAGGGDPSLSGRVYPYKKGAADLDPLAPLAALADQVVAAGVRAVSGDLVGDDTRYPAQPYPDGWAVGDIVWEYGAPAGALAFNDNIFTLRIQPGRAPGQPAAIDIAPLPDAFTIHNRLRTVAGARGPIAIDRAPGSRVIEVSGQVAPASRPTSELLAVDDPALFAARAFAQLLTARGVAIHGRILARHRAAGQPAPALPSVVLASRTSPPLHQILTTIAKASQNLHAEMVLRETGLAVAGDATARAAHEKLSEWLESIGAPARGADLEDGSGLSRRGLLSASTVVALLLHMHGSPHREAFRDMLPTAGRDGTLASRFRTSGDVSTIRAKTGSLSHVAALGGYAGDEASRRLAFSILANGFTAPSSSIRSLIDKIAVEILREGAR